MEKELSDFNVLEEINCICARLPLSHLNYINCALGMDPTEGRYGEVTMRKCIHCQRKWILYEMEDEGFSHSGRWYTGIVEDKDVFWIRTYNAFVYVKELSWYLYGGSYYNSTGIFHKLNARQS